MNTSEMIQALERQEQERHAAVLESLHHLAKTLGVIPLLPAPQSAGRRALPAPPVEPEPQPEPARRRGRKPKVKAERERPVMTEAEPTRSVRARKGGGRAASEYRLQLARAIAALAEPFTTGQAIEALQAAHPAATKWIEARNVPTALLAFTSKGWLRRQTAGTGHPATYTRTPRFSEAENAAGVVNRYAEFRSTIKTPEVEE